eukprot:882099-Pyramimonas_sp.AAC.1
MVRCASFPGAGDLQFVTELGARSVARLSRTPFQQRYAASPVKALWDNGGLHHGSDVIPAAALH